MKSINIVYDSEYNDADIVRVPDEIAENIEKVVWEFNTWLSVPVNRHRFLVRNANGELVLRIDTKEFLWWLDNIKIADGPKAEIIRQHTQYDSALPMAEF